MSTTKLSDMRQGLASLQPLVSLVQQASSQSTGFSYTGLGAGVITPAASGVILLLSAHFEEYLKSIIEVAMHQYARAVPVITRTRLNSDLQYKIINKNLKGASQEFVHGAQRSMPARLTALASVANRIVNDEIWGNDAIETHGNPSADTIKDLLSLVGVPTPWSGIQALFSAQWSVRRNTDPSLKHIPRANSELESFLFWRNTLAHTSAASLQIGQRELLDAIAFIEELAIAIDTLVCNETDSIISGLGSTPSTWP